MGDEGPKTTVTIGTRESQLAMVQAHHVHALLVKAHPQILDVSLSKIGSKSLFTKELEVALHEGTVDLVVHSLKDLPTTLPPGMVIGAILSREDPRDAVVMSPRWAGKRLQDLPEGSVIGTSSVRRSAQLRRRFPGLQFEDVRGNLNTRLKKLDAEDSPYAALLLAYAGLARLGWHERISEVLSPDTILHAVGQGALAIEVREQDQLTRELVKPLDDRTARLRCMAERAFMRKLEGGCSVPLGVWSELQQTTGNVHSLDGSQHVSGDDSILLDLSSDVFHQAEELGERLAATFVERGAAVILSEIRKK
ncbi:porphobilinogen deaminase, dipyromethane cofactor binding domain-containing protein [Chytridium lagenaria]|nr:porphobilinogen deaminase, dipyromethane cofactor binding domain-containing protein [Chytridium lagenaria]